MSIKDDVALLKTLPLFTKVDAAQLNVLAFSLERLALEDGEQLFRDGDAGDGAYLVIDGGLSLTRKGIGGETTLSLKRGDMVGEQTMFADVPYRGHARAVGRTTVLMISRNLFYKVAEEFPDLAIEAAKSVNEKLNATLADLRQVQRDL